MDLELKRTKFKVNVYGEVFDIRRPSAAEYKQFNKDVKDGASEDGAVSLMIQLLAKCGMPEAKLGDMEFEHLNELFMAVCGSKKK